MEQPDTTLWQLRELLSRYTQPCAGNCDHSQCPLLRELHALNISRTLDKARTTVGPIIDRERAGESVGDLMNMRLDSRASLAAVPNHALTQLLESALLHPESAEGNIRQVIGMLNAAVSSSLPAEPPPCVNHCKHDKRYMTGDPSQITEKRAWCVHEDADGFCGHACAPAEPLQPQTEHRCPRCGRRMQSDFDPDVGKWYECANCDYREAVSSSPAEPRQEGEQEQWTSDGCGLYRNGAWVLSAPVPEVAASLAHKLNERVTPPETPSDAAMRAAEEWLKSEWAKYYGGDFDEGVKALAAIITRYLVGTPTKVRVLVHKCGRVVRPYPAVLCSACRDTGEMDAALEELCRWYTELAATPLPETPPNHALVQLLNSALIHPASAEGNIRQVIEMLGATGVVATDDDADARAEEIVREWVSSLTYGHLPPGKISDLTARIAVALRTNVEGEK